MPHTWDPDVLPPEDALRRLKEGNRRFMEGGGQALAGSWHERMATAVQRPFSIVLGCSDSRTPVEVIFDQGFGELFVVRLAGNIAGPSALGSIEFAASQFGTRLVVVMGHTRCGAVGATLRALESGEGPESRNIRSITDRIAPHLEGIDRKGAPEAVHRAGVEANVRAVVKELEAAGPLLQKLVQAGRIRVLGAVYELETGAVVFFDR